MSPSVSPGVVPVVVAVGAALSTLPLPTETVFHSLRRVPVGVVLACAVVAYWAVYLRWARA
jgi:hypothetical protein